MINSISDIRGALIQTSPNQSGFNRPDQNVNDLLRSRCVVVFDIDGVLANNSFRGTIFQEYIVKKYGNDAHRKLGDDDWNYYDRIACPEPPIQSGRILLDVFRNSPNHYPICVTGRSSRTSLRTRIWMGKNLNWNDPYIIHRSLNDHGSNYEVKEKIFKELHESGASVCLWIDDNPEISKLSCPTMIVTPDYDIIEPLSGLDGL